MTGRKFLDTKRKISVAILSNIQERKCGLPFHKVNYKKITLLAEAKGNHKILLYMV